MKHSCTDNSLSMCMRALYNNMHRELHTAYAKPPEELAIFQNFWSFICIISCFRLICLHQCNILICMYIMWQYNVIRKLNEHFQLYGTHPHVDKCTGNSRTIHRWISWSQNDSELLNKQSKLSQHWIRPVHKVPSMRIQCVFKRSHSYAHWRWCAFQFTSVKPTREVVSMRIRLADPACM